jgi:hypothetical protein
MIMPQGTISGKHQSDQLNMIGASRGALLNMKGGLRANHRLLSDDIYRIGVVACPSFDVRGSVSPQKMPPINAKGVVSHNLMI